MREGLHALKILLALLSACLSAPMWIAAVAAEPVAVAYTEGLVRGFPVLSSMKGKKLAQGELVQVA